ncbi:ankyrin repeat domain-containing protein [Wolbachia endosymbiont of Cruorifilaria tuberocauda]|uniref:ankyrin repeat domain-containing protein n=1 Tax=Wolbachia endosymbiont of Cruorifilaria tuberocauda TaxID=1812111 RepID=UPI001FE3CFB0|nr:hypothetical protein [Wolbachia endosymbiont of Cruorifilaria tuberocauda]
MFKFFLKLPKYKISSSNLELSIDELQGIREEQKDYYDLLEKLMELVKQSRLEQKICIEKEIKDVMTHALNALDINNYFIINNYNKKLFKELLQKQFDIRHEVANGNNALHLIALKLKKEQFISAINNNKNREGQTLLHQLLYYIHERSKNPSSISKIKNVVRKEFKDKNRHKMLKFLLENGADIITQDKKENNALHYIISLKGKQKIAYLKLILGKNEFSSALNTINEKGETPLHKLLQYVQKKSEKFSLVSFKNTKRYEALKLLLRNGVDITIKDGNKKNVLHYIALLKGEQKVVCLDLIVKNCNTPKDKLSIAVNAKDSKEQTPLQVALISKVVKDKYNSFNFKNSNNTIKFCVKLLQNGADIKQLVLPESLWNREYYQILKGIEKSMGKLLIPDDIRAELKLNFGKKFKARNVVKHAKNIVYKAITTFIFATLICTVIFSVAYGSITITTALSIISATGVYYLICVNLDNLYEGLKKTKRKLTKEKQIILHNNTIKNGTQHNDSSQSMGNKPNSLEKQRTQELEEQLKYTKSLPSFRIDGISIYQLTKELLKFNKQINKSSSLVL